MVVDTSALVAVLFAEPEASAMSEAMAKASRRLISVVSRVELSLVVEGRKGAKGREAVERLLNEGGFEIVAATATQAAHAIEAFRRFGKGRHPAGLTIGDCFSYALAKDVGEPLLFKGADFSATDIVSALS